MPSSAAWVTKLCLSGAQSAGRRAFPWSLSRTARPRAGNTAVPSRTQSRGHQEAAAPAASGNPGASNAQAAFAASPQEHSLKPTLARWPRPREQAGHPTRQLGVSPGPTCRAAVHSRGRDWCPGWPNPPGFAIPGSPPLQLAVGEDVDLAARAGDAQEPGHRGAGTAGRERPGSPARRPVLISTARPLASRQLARDRPVTSRLTATGEQSGGDARGAGTDAMPGSPLSAAMAWAPGFIWGKARAGKDAGGPGPSRSSGCRSGPGQLQSRAGAREQGRDVADGGFLAGGFGQREVRLDLVAVAAAVFLLRHAAARSGR